MSFFREHKTYFIAMLLITVFFVGLNAFLPEVLKGDEVVTLLVDASTKDPSYPGYELFRSMEHNGTYLFNPIISFFDRTFAPLVYSKIFLSILILSTLVAAFVSLRLMGVSKQSSFVTSLIALIPRMSPGMTYFGVLTEKEVAGRSFGMPLMWLLVGVLVYRMQRGKSLWQVFLFAGLAVYMHPVSMVFMSAILFAILLGYLVMSKPPIKVAVKEFAKSLGAFLLVASALIHNIVSTVSSALPDGAVVEGGGAAFAEALAFRMPWDFIGETLRWMRHVGVVSFFFVVVILYVGYLLYKKRTVLSRAERTAALVGGAVLGIGVVASLVLPNLQLWLVATYDAPFVLQQSSRFFKFYYLGLFILFAVALDILRKTWNHRYITPVVLVLGLLSSSVGFEWTQYVLGYQNYEKAYIPLALQEEPHVDKRTKYAEICSALEAAGVESGERLISSDFNLRYFCRVDLYTTYEEGTFYMMRGKEDMLYWYDIYTEQDGILKGDDIDAFIAFMESKESRTAVLSNGTALYDAVGESTLEYTDTQNKRIVHITK